jgi:hypothetical protein
VRAAEAVRERWTRMAASTGTDGATPMKLSIVTETTGPAITSSLGRQRSARCPNPICDTDEAS